MTRILLPAFGLAFLILSAVTPLAAQEAGKSLFDGKTLKGWKATNFGGEGDVTIEKGAIRIEKGSPMTGITIDQKDLPTIDYELSLEAKRLVGSDFFCTTTFPIGEKHCSLVVGGWGGAVVGISSLNDFDASENETTTIQDFERDRWYKIRIRVTKAKLEAWIDQKQIVNVELKDKRISMRAECEPCRPFGIATYNTTSAIREILVRNLKDGK